MLDSDEPEAGSTYCVSLSLQRLAYNLIRFRARRGFSQADLATLIGITENDLDCIERGLVNVTLNRLSELATFLECSERDLLLPPEEQGS
jgi:transcriptional regulator with XRE-family HTH domain